MNNEEFDDGAEVNLEGELMCALSELEKLRKKNALLKEWLTKYKEEYYETNGETETRRG